MRLVGVLAIILLISPVVAAQETAMLVSVSFRPDSSAVLENVEVTLAGIDEPLSRALSDSIELVVNGTTYYNTHVPVTYRVLDAQGVLPEFTVTRRLPYFGNKGRLRVMRNENVVIDYDLSRLCNNDGFCSGFENGLSCAADCDIRTPDQVCLPYPDKACDPDCAKNLDPDCAPRTPADLPLPLFFIAGLMVVMLAYFIYRQRR